MVIIIINDNNFYEHDVKLEMVKCNMTCVNKT